MLNISVLYYLMKCDKTHFLHPVKISRINAWTKFSEAKRWSVDLNVFQSLNDALASWYYEGETTDLVERESSKTT